MSETSETSEQGDLNSESTERATTDASSGATVRGPLAPLTDDTAEFRRTLARAVSPGSFEQLTGEEGELIEKSIGSAFDDLARKARLNRAGESEQ